MLIAISQISKLGSGRVTATIEVLNSQGIIGADIIAALCRGVAILWVILHDGIAGVILGVR